MDITREWLKAGLTANSDSVLVETIMPLLHVSLIRAVEARSGPDELSLDRG